MLKTDLDEYFGYCTSCGQSKRREIIFFFEQMCIFEWPKIDGQNVLCYDDHAFEWKKREDKNINTVFNEEEKMASWMNLSQ